MVWSDVKFMKVQVYTDSSREGRHWRIITQHRNKHCKKHFHSPQNVVYTPSSCAGNSLNVPTGRASFCLLWHKSGGSSDHDCVLDG